MKHKQILDKINADTQISALEDDLVTLLASKLIYPKNKGKSTQALTDAGALEPLFERWQSALTSDNTILRQKIMLAMATLLHKYGIQLPNITADALAAIDALNDSVVLSDAFYRQSDAIKAFLNTAPTSVVKKPRARKPACLFRAQDVVAMRYRGRYYAFYVHEITPSSQPRIEFYDAIFDALPGIDALKNIPAKGYYHSTDIYPARMFEVISLNHLPDPAGQYTLMASGVAAKPDRSHLTSHETTDNFGFLIDIFELHREVDQLFSLNEGV